MRKASIFITNMLRLPVILTGTYYHMPFPYFIVSVEQIDCYFNLIMILLLNLFYKYNYYLLQI